MYTKSVCATSTRPSGEVGGMSPLQLSSRTQFAKIEDKKVIAEISSKNLTAGFLKLLMQIKYLYSYTRNSVGHAVPVSYNILTRLKSDPRVIIL